MRCFIASLNKEYINKWGVLLPPSTKSGSMNDEICCLHQQRVHQWMRYFVASINKECINKWGVLLPRSTKSASINEVFCCLHQLMEATKHLIYWCTLCWWRQQNTSFIDALFVDGGNKTPHLLMHSLLMEATKHLIYWCTLCWWKQQMRCFVASINKECINKWGVLLPPSTKSASINEVFYCLPQQRVHQ
jgi:hypothetical protein